MSARKFKVYCDSEIYRFDIPHPQIPSFLNLEKFISERVVGQNTSYKIYWQDDEGDFIVIANESDFRLCLESNTNELMPLKLHVRLNKDSSPNTASSQSPAQPPQMGGDSEVDKVCHPGVMCDECDRSVFGYRYKCLTCEDFDLCEECEGKRLHSEHCMLRLPEPLTSRHEIKSALKRSWRVFKNVSTAEDKDVGHKKKRDRSAEKKHRHHGDQHGKRSEHHHRSELRSRCRSERRSEFSHQRGSWLETFTNYMNQFANLAGDMEYSLHPETGSTKVPQNTPQANTGANTPKNTETPAASAQNHCELLINKLISHENFQGLFELQKTLQEILIPQPPKGGAAKGNQYDTSAVNDVEMENEPNTVPAGDAKGNNSVDGNNAAEAKAEVKNANDKLESPTKETPEIVKPTLPSGDAQPSTSTQAFPQVKIQDYSKDKLMDLHKKLATILAEAQKEQNAAKAAAVEAKNGVEITKEGGEIDSDASTDSDSKLSDSGSEKGDDWTLINKDVNDYIVDKSSPPSAPLDPAPIGFNLPKEFSERVQISGQSLYPPLNVDTAVLNPLQPETVTKPQEPVKPPTQPAEQPQAQATPPTQPAQPVEPPRKPHPKLHVEQAIQQMMAMGLKNDGGWLTQLLESYNGDISAVLDILTPVKPTSK